jgi:hypothetical protein
VARAKRTDRAEARRRTRAALAEEVSEPSEASTVGGPDDRASRSAPAPSGTAGKTPGNKASGPSGRPSLLTALRSSYHPANVREDLRYLPKLLIHPAVWGPILATAAVAGLYLVTGGRDVISSFLVPFFVWPPPQIGVMFITGFFAPRASYMAGFIVGVASSLIVALLVALGPATAANFQGSSVPTASAGPSVAASAAASTAPSGAPDVSASPSTSAGASAAPNGSPAPGSSAPPAATTPITPVQVLIAGLGVAPFSGVFLASLAAWYRRFLQASSPRRAASVGGKRPNNRQSNTSRRR